MILEIMAIGGLVIFGVVVVQVVLLLKHQRQKQLRQDIQKRMKILDELEEENKMELLEEAKGKAASQEEKESCSPSTLPPSSPLPTSVFQPNFGQEPEVKS